MSGPSVSPTQLAAVALDTGVGVVADVYTPESMFYPQFCEVIDVASASHPFYGDKSTTLIGQAQPERREDGAPIKHSTMGLGYTPQGAIHAYANKISIPERLVLSAGVNPQAKIRSLTEEFIADFTRRAMILKDEIVAAQVTNGAKTAGDINIYNQSFPGNDDPYPTLGYDGVCYFAGAHPIKYGSTTYDNHDTGTNLTAANLDAAKVRMQTTNAVDETGKRISIRAGVLMVPTALEATAKVLLNSQNLPGSGNNDVNYNLNSFQLIANPYLTDADAWMLIATQRTLRVIDSGAPVVRTWFNEDTRCIDVSAEYHFGCYLRDWRGWYAANLATS